MANEDLTGLFREKLRECAQRKKKYREQFTAADEAQAAYVFQFVCEHPNLSEDLIFDYLTGKKSS